MIEYALIASLVAVAVIIALRSTGKKVNNTFNIVSETFQPPDAIYHDTPKGL
ncbi:hypothetical protein FACS1894122_13450 [Alphaproteobacteria bacterium]|nr:hypothetical protein FACS1894122_13450 [Alphaproteobacteria bacterium]